MNRLNQKVFLVLFSICWASFANGQIQYFGAESQFLLAPTKGSQVVVSGGWVFQLSAHHGIGADLNLPFYLQSNPAKPFIVEPVYEANLAWKRWMLPFPGIRYRLFLGNSFFVGTSFNVGLIRESFYANRAYQPASVFYSAIPAVQADYKIKSPFFRVNLETGFNFHSEGKLFGSLHTRLGFQATNPPMDPFSTFALNSGGSVPFRPYHGKDLFLSIVLGLGVKK